ncbi:hypothetical protein WKN16_004654 [Vibrio parahaemolyticus]
MYKNSTKKSGVISPELVQEVRCWVEKNGLKFTNTRFHVAQKRLEQWCTDGLIPSHEELWNIAELLDLCEIYTNLSSDQITEPVFRDILAGSDYLKDEKKTRARDYFFECKVASRLKRAGFKLIDSKAHDVVTTKGGETYGAECKRAKSIKKLIENFDKAYGQLQPLESRKDNGMIFIDLSKMLYHEFIDNVDKPFLDPELFTKFRQEFDFLVKDELERVNLKKLHNIKICVVHFAFPGLIENYGLVKVSHFVSYYAKSDANTKEILNALHTSVGTNITKH